VFLPGSGHREAPWKPEPPEVLRRNTKASYPPGFKGAVMAEVGPDTCRWRYRIPVPIVIL
jgi:hypothetical protein